MSASAIAIMLFFMSTSGNAVSKDALARAPRLVVENDYGTLSTEKPRGNYIILNFWNPGDAKSRINNKQLASAADNGEINKVSYAGIYSGDDDSLAKSTIKSDGLNPEHQYMLSQAPDTDNIFSDYSLSTGNHTFLISPDGRVVAINPSLEEIKSITAS